jgi:hypothetical protein
MKEVKQARVVESRVLTKMFLPKREKVTEVWRKFCNKLENLLYQILSGDKMKNNVIGGACSIYGERVSENA